jgi:hypothetical protein
MEEPLHVYFSLPVFGKPAAAAAGLKPKKIAVVIVINELFPFRTFTVPLHC